MKILVILSFLMLGSVRQAVSVPLAEPQAPSPTPGGMGNEFQKIPMGEQPAPPGKQESANGQPPPSAQVSPNPPPPATTPPPQGGKPTGGEKEGTSTSTVVKTITILVGKDGKPLGPGNNPAMVNPASPTGRPVEEKKPQGDKPPESKKPENKAPEIKAPENKPPETKAPENKPPAQTPTSPPPPPPPSSNPPPKPSTTPPPPPPPPPPPATSQPPKPTSQPPPPPPPAATGPAVLKQLPNNPIDWFKAEAVEPPNKDKKFPGIVVTPYRDKEINNDGCKSVPELKKDLERVKDFSMVRSYGTSCQQIQRYIQAIKELKLEMKIMLGVKGDNANVELKELWAALGDNFAMVDSISVGNEVVLAIPEGDKAGRGKRVGELAAYAARVRSDLVGFKHTEIPVVIIDSWVVVKDYPELCKASDYMAVNVHPWFNPDQASKDAGKFLIDVVVKELRKVFDGGCQKPIRITEIGWPHDALPNPKITDKRKATQPDQDTALKAIVEAVGGSRSTIYLTAVDERWKSKQDHIDPLGAEQFWGIANLGLLKKP